jgi:hypothetical protein
MKQILSLIIVAGFVTSASAATLKKPVKGKCVFGEDTQSLRESKRFKVQEDVIKTFKMWRGNSQPWRDEDQKPVMVSVSIVTDKKTGNVYHMNETFRHIDDGDNTVGWIEEVNNAADLDSGYEGEGRVVADVGDADIGNCSVRE